MVENFENISKEKLVFMLKEYQNKVQSLQTEVDFYKGKFALANKKRFGRISEKTDDQQLNFWSQLFNEPETIVEIAGKVAEEENDMIWTKTRKSVKTVVKRYAVLVKN